MNEQLLDKLREDIVELKTGQVAIAGDVKIGTLQNENLSKQLSALTDMVSEQLLRHDATQDDHGERIVALETTNRMNRWWLAALSAGVGALAAMRTFLNGK